MASNHGVLISIDQVREGLGTNHRLDPVHENSAAADQRLLELIVYIEDWLCEIGHGVSVEGIRRGVLDFNEGNGALVVYIEVY